MKEITSGEHEVYFNARFMADKHTHYEVSAYIDRIRQCTITIPGTIVNDFTNKHGDNIRNYIIYAKIFFIENQRHVAPDVYKNSSHLRGTLHSLDEIVRIEKL